jgi:tetraacyldisaccharide 4'-kinase
MFEVDQLRGQPVAVVSAIGNPLAFERTVARCGAEVVATRRLPDHDPYDPATVDSLRSWVESLDPRVSRVVCTHKDLVKLQADRLAGRPLVALLIELQLIGDEATLDHALEAVVAE